MSSPSHNNAIRIAFLVALAGKIISAVLSIILNSPWVFGFGIPLTIMLVYMIFGHFQTHKGCYRIRQGYGDSCYYLGFLFTVASIILALFVLGSEDNLVTSELAIRFAAAMITTLLGMAVRVYIVTFADKEDEKLPITEQTIAITPQVINDSDSFEVRVQANLDNLRTLNQSLINNIDSAEKMRISLQSLVGRVQSDLEEMTKSTEKYLQSLMENTSNLLTDTQTKFNAALEETVRDTANQMHLLVQNSTDNAQQYVQGALKNIEQISVASKDSLRESSELLASTFNDTAQARIQTFTENTEKLGQAVESLSQHISSIEKPIGSLKESVQETKRTLESDISAKLNADVDHVRAKMTQLSASTDDLLTKTTAISKNLKDTKPRGLFGFFKRK